MKIAKIEWTDISAEDNKNRYARVDLPVNITFGIVFRKLKINGIWYYEIIRNANLTDKIDEMDSDDLIFIPVGCIIKITPYEDIKLANKKVFTHEELTEIKKYIKGGKNEKID